MKKADEPLTLLGIPVRVDATLCAPGEVWLESPKGEAVKVWPDGPHDASLQPVRIVEKP